MIRIPSSTIAVLRVLAWSKASFFRHELRSPNSRDSWGMVGVINPVSFCLFQRLCPDRANLFALDTAYEAVPYIWDTVSVVLETRVCCPLSFAIHFAGRFRDLSSLPLASRQVDFLTYHSQSHRFIFSCTGTNLLNSVERNHLSRVSEGASQECLLPAKPGRAHTK